MQLETNMIIIDHLLFLVLTVVHPVAGYMTDAVKIPWRQGFIYLWFVIL